MVIAIALIVVISVALLISFLWFQGTKSSAGQANGDKYSSDIIEEISSVQGTIWSDADDLQVWLTEIKVY